tara:strand:- start:29 stop:496 length:468 start_codon:yes stop_codon:yes gene_type:complete
MKNIIILISIFFAFANCSVKKAVQHHGVHKLELKEKKIIVNKSNKNDAIVILGPPSTVSTFNNELLIFIERKLVNGSIIVLGKKRILVNNVLILEINNYGLVSKKTFYDLNKMKDIEFSKNITEVDYSQRTFIYQFLSSMRQKINDPLGKRNKKN